MVISEHKLGPGPLSPGRRKWYAVVFVSYVRVQHVQQDVCVCHFHSFIYLLLHKHPKKSRWHVKVIHYEVINKNHL